VSRDELSQGSNAVRRVDQWLSGVSGRFPRTPPPPTPPPPSLRLTRSSSGKSVRTSEPPLFVPAMLTDVLVLIVSCFHSEETQMQVRARLNCAVCASPLLARVPVSDPTFAPSPAMDRRQAVVVLARDGRVPRLRAGPAERDPAWRPHEVRCCDCLRLSC